MHFYCKRTFSMSYFSTISRCACRLVPFVARNRQCALLYPQAYSSFRPSAAALFRQVHLTPSSYSSDVSDTSVSKLPTQEELVPERLYSKIKIKIKGADNRVLESYCRFVVTAGKALDINVGGRLALPTRIQKFTVLKSAHIFKKHRVQYEIRTHMRLMEVKEITGTTADIFLEYIQRNLPEGVSMAVYQERLDTLPALLTGPPEGEEPESTDTPTIGGKRKSKFVKKK